MSKLALTVCGIALAMGSTAWAQVTRRLSVDSSGVQGNGPSGSSPFFTSTSADGRYVAFPSEASNLVPGDTNGLSDIFVRDLQSGTTERVSVDSSAGEADDYSTFPAISPDGRYVAFWSEATNLVPGDTNGVADIFVRDRQSGTTERVSVDASGTGGDAYSSDPSISADGRYVCFVSDATNLVTGDTNGTRDVFVHDRQSGTTERVSVDSSGGEGNGFSGYFFPSISGDGRYVAFASGATDLVLGDTNGFTDIFVRDRQNGTTERVSVDSAGGEGNGSSLTPSISADGRYVAFSGDSTNLVPGDTNGFDDVFVRDRQNGTTERASLDSSGAEGDADSSAPWISTDGLHVSFASAATNLVPGDSNAARDIFVRDLQGGTTERVSVDSGAAEANGESYAPSISADGRHVAFTSAATNLVPGDTNGFNDVFVRDSVGGTTFTSLCDPGIGGVIACPCSNAPSGIGRGCDNSAATGGAVLTASGGTNLSSDSLVFTTSDGTPAELNIVVQSSVPAPAGLVYGQGVRCVAGVLVRLYVKTAVGGSVTAPEFGIGDPPVSARSAAKGDVIQSGQSRWYYVYYRDATVLGGCPASSAFNATQTGLVVWSP